MLLKILAKNEKEFILQEYSIREKQSKRFYPETTEEDRENALSNSPTICRGEELYICPTESGWENRYYKVLFHTQVQEVIPSITRNYLEGLEWVFNYYTKGTRHYRWKYNYHYPPLLRDLYRYCPQDETKMLTQYTEPYTMEEQLRYVLPPIQLLYENIIDDEEYRKTSYKHIQNLEWAFCKYLWEAHLVSKIDL
jgi:5'-3' exonuclease